MATSALAVNPYILQFDAIGLTDLALAGGKGANLRELVRAGLPVPDEFCLATDAYRRFIEITGVDAFVGRVLPDPRGRVGTNGAGGGPNRSSRWTQLGGDRRRARHQLSSRFPPDAECELHHRRRARHHARSPIHAHSHPNDYLRARLHA